MVQKNQNYQKKYNFFVGQNHCKVDGPSIPEIIKIQPFHHKLWKNFFSEVGQCNFTAAKKPFFLPFLDTKPFFPIKMTKHHDKQLTPPESWDQYVFLALVWVSSTSNHWARIFTTLWPPNQGEHLDRLIYIAPSGCVPYLASLSKGLIRENPFLVI